MHGSIASRETILKLASGVDPGCVDIIPRNLVTVQLLTWLYSEHTDTKYFSDSVTCNIRLHILSKNCMFSMRYTVILLTRTFVTLLWWTVNVWNNCGPCPTVSGCCTITLTLPDFVPYAISIQFPHTPVHQELHSTFSACYVYTFRFFDESIFVNKKYKNHKVGVMYINVNIENFRF